MIKLLNKFFALFGYKLTTIIPTTKRVITKKLTKVAIARKFNFKYSQVGWLHVSLVKQNPNISRKELIEKVKQVHQESNEESKRQRREKKLIQHLNSLQENKTNSLKSTNIKEVA